MAQRTSGGVEARKKGALQRLQAQLVSKVKNGKEQHAKEPNGYHMVSAVLPLTEGDIVRINKEISILKTRI